MLDRNPTQILRKAIFGMLRKNKLRHGYIEPRLKIYTGATHPHTAQLPMSGSSGGGVEPLPKVPEKLNGNFHFGLRTYAHPKSYQMGVNINMNNNNKMGSPSAPL
jgi:Ribosomal protein L13